MAISEDSIGTLSTLGFFVITSVVTAWWKRRNDTSRTEPDSKKLHRLVRYLSDRPKWESYDEDQELFVQALPKIELHVHLDGSFDPDYLWKYMQEHPESLYCLPVESNPPWTDETLKIRSMVEECKTALDYHGLCTCRGTRSLKEMLNAFEVFLPLVRNNLALIEQLSYDFCRRQWEQNIIYTEVRYSPHLLAESFARSASQDEETISPQDVLAAVTRGLREGSKELGITVNQILCAIAWRPDWAMSTVELAQEHRDDYPCATVGVDIASGEEHFDAEKHPDLFKPHYDMMQEAQKLKLPITIHAGEDPGSTAIDHVRRAIDDYGATRIGHGYRIADSPDMMAEVRRKGIHIEVCPTSSNETGGWVYTSKNWKEHPCISMINNGVSVGLNSDDPGVFHTSLAWQYRLSLAKMKLDPDVIVQTNLDAIDASFCQQEEKERLKKIILKYRTPASKRAFNQLLRESLSQSFSDRVYLDDAEKS